RYGVDESGLNLNLGFQQRVLPYLAPADRTGLRQMLEPLLAAIPWPSQSHDAPSLPLLLAASLGGSATVAQIVESWPDRKGGGAPDLHPQSAEMILGLNSAAEVLRHAARLRLRFESATDARAWVAHTELDGLDLLLESILAQRARKNAEPLARVLALAQTPSAAPYLLQIMVTSSAPAIGRDWLERHPERAIPGLIEPALGRGRVAEAARELLQSLRRAGQGAAVDEALTSIGERAAKLRTSLETPKAGAAPPLDDASTPAWLQAATAQPLLPRRPEWLPPGELPSITLKGQPLTSAQEEAVLSALQRSTLKEPRPILEHLKREADPHSLDAFVSRLCTLWQQRGRKGKEIWALEAMGLLGGDGAALKLGPLAKEWREKILHRPAGLAIDCLAAIGSDTALAQLRNFTLIPRDWSLKLTADNHIKEAAKARGLSEEELEDRLVPDLGLGKGRKCAFDFGPRQFSLALGEGLKPMIRGADGALRGDLPKPNAKDDAALAERAAAEWKLLKKQLAEVLKAQAKRLEQAMIHGRRWSATEFEAVFLQQPVMALLARSLVWAAHAADGSPSVTFGVSEDHTLSNVSDAGFQLPAEATVSIPHPLQLSALELSQWGEHLADYGLAPPFPQVGRAIHRPTDVEAVANRLDRFNHLPCMAIALAEGLERTGWRRDDVGGGGCYSAHLREFPAAGVWAVVEYQPGIYISSPRASDEQQLTGCTFHRGGPRSGPELRLGDVDPIVFSETVESLWTAVGRR
ncbi:MAG: DUF4132 domain-containing protein, partial [Actinomycetota bacterium]